MNREINRNSVIVSKDGGVLDIISEHGERLTSIAVPAGRVRASQYLDLVPRGATLEVAEGLVVFHPRSRVGILPYGEGSHESGANPDFQPSSASRMEREMRLQLDRLKANNDRIERRARALDLIERVSRTESPAPASDAARNGESPAPSPASRPNASAEAASE